MTSLLEEGLKVSFTFSVSGFRSLTGGSNFYSLSSFLSTTSSRETTDSSGRRTRTAASSATDFWREIRICRRRQRCPCFRPSTSFARRSPTAGKKKGLRGYKEGVFLAPQFAYFSLLSPLAARLLFLSALVRWLLTCLHWLIPCERSLKVVVRHFY